MCLQTEIDSFLDKYTKGKANEVVKGFLAMSSDSAYERARKLLDERFGNPVHVAEAYKSRFWNQWSFLTTEMQHYVGFISLRGGSSPERVRSTIPTT